MGHVFLKLTGAELEVGEGFVFFAAAVAFVGAGKNEEVERFADRHEAPEGLRGGGDLSERWMGDGDEKGVEVVLGAFGDGGDVREGGGEITGIWLHRERGLLERRQDGIRGVARRCGHLGALERGADAGKGEAGPSRDNGGKNNMEANWFQVQNEYMAKIKIGENY